MSGLKGAGTELILSGVCHVHVLTKGHAYLFKFMCRRILFICHSLVLAQDHQSQSRMDVILMSNTLVFL